MPTGNDDFGSADEVRIYKDEGEDDVQRVSENLSEDKIGLVTETEKRAEACGNSPANLAAAKGNQLDGNMLQAWSSNPSANAAASFYSSFFNSSYNGLLQQYQLQQLVSGLMSAPPTSNNPVLSMQAALDAKRARERERDDPVSSPPALSPLTVPGCSSPMLSVLAAAMSGALSPVSNAPLHPTGTPSPRGMTPNASANVYRPHSLGSSWPFGVPMAVGVGVQNTSNHLMPPPASPFAFGSSSQTPPSTTSSSALVAAMLNKMQHAAAANLLTTSPAARPSAHSEISRAHQQGEHERRTQAAREHERVFGSRREVDRERTNAANANARATDSSSRLTNSISPARHADASRACAEARSTNESSRKGAIGEPHNGHSSPVANGESASRKRPHNAIAVKHADLETLDKDAIEHDADDGDDDDMDSDLNGDDSEDSTAELNASGDGDTATQGPQRTEGTGGGSGSTTSSVAAVRRWTNVKKPLNAFMLFMKEQRAAVMGESALKESAAINQLLGRKWHALERREQEKYYELARRVKEEHARLYPGWSARDNYAMHSRRKKRRLLSSFAPPIAGDRSGAGPLDMPGASARDCASPKKCRARFGLENQKDWCKPCRRKKKCIRFAAETERALAANAANKQLRAAADQRQDFFAAGMLKSPFAFSADFGLPPAQSHASQFPFGLPINVETYLQIAGGNPAYRFPFGPPSGLGYSQSPLAAALGAVRPLPPHLPPLLSGHLDAPSTCCASPDADPSGGRIGRCSSSASSRVTTVRRSEAECNNLVSESDDDDPHGSRPHDDADAEEKPITRIAAENEKDAPFAFDDEPNLSPLSVDEDDTAMLRGGTLVASSPRKLSPNSSITVACSARRTVEVCASGNGNANANANGPLALELPASQTDKRRDADSQNNNAARSAHLTTSSESASSLVDSTPLSSENATAARQTEPPVADELRQHSAERLCRIAVLECNAVS